MTLTEELKYRDALKEAKEIKKAAQELVDILTEIEARPEFYVELYGPGYEVKLENLKKVLKNAQSTGS